MASPETSTADAYWVATTPARSSGAPLSGDGGRFDVAIVGGGIVGLTAALVLQRAGRSVVLLEAARVGAQVTGRSTAKVTSQHGLIYTHLEDHAGDAAARAYAQSNEAALAWITAKIGERGIDCDLERVPAFVYSNENAEAIEQEAEAARRAGLTAALVRETDLPFEVEAALRFDAQAQFHPLKYTDALAAELGECGGRIYESSRVVDIDSGRPCKLATNEGTVRADDVIVATNIPILDRGGFFGRAFPYRHMCIAAPVDRDKVPTGMFISADEPTRSLRSTVWSEQQRLMVFVGEGFPTGHADTAQKLRDIEEFARRHFGVSKPTHRWGNQDYYAADRLPYVGPVLPGSRHVRVATGFNGWGITTGTVAALILADETLGRENDWAWLYDSRRLGLRAGGRKIVQKNFAVAKSWLGEHLRPTPAHDLASIEPGEAAITKIDGRPAAAFRDAGGVLHAVDAHCTHMGCEVHWNAAEKSWDCHCHGSRFDPDGRVLHGPAVHPLRSIAR